MASSVPDAIRVSKLLGFDYTKFENTKLAAEKRKSSGETNKMRNKKILVNPVRASSTSVECGSKNIEGGELAVKSGRRSVPSDKLNSSKFVKRSSSETKEIKAKSDEIEKVRKKFPVDKVNVTKSHARESPLMEVRKKLDFKDELDDEVTPLRKGLDFTDKIAALRSLIHRDRETKDITDRRAYYDEYKSRHRKVMVTRSDSLKENQEQNEVETVDNYFDNRNGKTRRIQSADIFKEKHLDGRLSAVDLHTLKEKLGEKRNRKIENDKPIKAFSVNKNNNAIDEVFNENNNDADLSHAKRGRKVIAARPRKMNVTADTCEPMEGNTMPGSRTDSKEIQTNLLNQSIRSVQSNAPFYEPLGRPVSAPVLQCGISVGKKTVLCRNNDIGGIERGVKADFTDSGKEDKQSNLDNFVGTSLTPEKDRKRQKHRVTSAKEAGHLDKSVNGDVIRRRTDSTERRKHDSRNHRPSSRNGRSSESRKTPDIISASQKLRRSPDNHLRNSNDDVRGEITEKQIDRRQLRSTEKSERKVREWIKNQERLRNGQINDDKLHDSGPMLMDELNISISIPTNRKVQANPLANCDNYPDKLKKSKSDKRQPLNSTSAYGVIQPKDGFSGAPYDSKAIFDKLEHITMAVVTQQHQLEVEIPMKDIQMRRESQRYKDFSPVKGSHSEKVVEAGRRTPGRFVESDTASTE